MRTQVLLQAENLALGYEGRVVISGLNFEVKQGEYLCIVGENGSGKTTLMRAILGFNAPMSGKLHLPGGLLRERIGYLPQQTQVQRDFPASVREVVRSGCLKQNGLRPWYTLAQKAQADQAMERLGVQKLAKSSYRTLSGGQQQRVLLARALCAAGAMLLLDEPASGLDPLIAQELYELIASLNHEGLTIVMISHDLPSVLQYATHVLHLAKTPLFFGETASYLASNPRLLLQNKEGA